MSPVEEELIRKSIEDYDSFGKRHGTRMLVQHRDAWQEVRKWTPTAFGQRPTDWGAVDLIVGSTFRESGDYFVRELAQSDHPLLLPNLLTSESQCLNSTEQKRRRNALAYLYHHYARLLNWSEQCDEKWIRSMLDCPPTMFHCERQNGFQLLSCRYANRCPFCLTRAAAKCYRRLESRFQTASPEIYAIVTAISKVDVANNSSNAASELKETKRLHHQIFRMQAEEAKATGGMLGNQLIPHLAESPKFDQVSRQIRTIDPVAYL